MNGEHFLPFRRSDVVAMCSAELPEPERVPFVGLTRVLASLLHHRFQDRIEALKDAYHPFHPEADTHTLREPSADERAAAQVRLEAELTELAEAANFIPMDVDALESAYRGHSLLKVRMAVDTSAIDKVILFRRGEAEHTRTVPSWFGLRRRPVTFTNYARVLIYAKFKDAGHFRAKDVDKLAFRPGSTIVKLFQNVPKNDLEMVFPNVEVRMRAIDKLLIGIPALISGVVVIATKVIASVGLLLVLLGFWLGITRTMPPISPTAVASIGAGLFAFGGYLVRQVTKFKNRKILFMKALSENLYFRNLDNDAGVFHHLLDAAEEAEVIESVLAYHFLRTAGTAQTPDELDRRVERFFASRWGTEFDFEVDDGLRKLRELELITVDSEGRLSAVPLEEARNRIEQLWDVALDRAPSTVPMQRTAS